MRQIKPEPSPLTAQKAGLVPALALTLHLLGEVDRFLAAAALVSSSERHPESKQNSPVFHPLYTRCVSLVGSALMSLLQAAAPPRPAATAK